MEGTITNIIPERGAIIEAHGALIQGVWGNGKIAYGIVQPVSNDMLQELIPEQLNIGFRGTILTAGYCKNPEVLEAAGNIPIKGLILGSISAELIPLAKKVDYPIIVIDGFGESAMNKAAEGILIANKEKNITVNAQGYDPLLGEFPEVIISLAPQTDPELPVEIESLKAGKKVIIINGTKGSKIGKIESILPGKQILPSGIESQVAEVSFESDKRMTIPLTNLEILNG